VPKAIEGEKKVNALVLEDGRRLAVDGVFVAVGTVPKTELLQGVVPLDAQGYVIADETGSTAVPGFYVAGDARTKKLRQVVTAVADGANAATEAAEYIRRGTL
jgi:thioredoxin reductase (NADPH)